MAEMLSQEEIDALLNGGSDDDSSSQSSQALTAEEMDALGEIGNISMGTASTTLFTLLNQKVTITTPRVFETDLENLAKDFSDPLVLISIRYKYGIEGINLLILAEKDVKIITDLMMGGDGTNLADELTDLHLSAINEAMNQMIGSSSTSLSEMLGSKIDISPPEALYDSISNIDLSGLGINPSDPLVKIAFRMTVGDLIDSEIMQVLPLEVAKQMVATLMDNSANMVNASQPAQAPVQNDPPPMQQQAPVNNMQQEQPQQMRQNQPMQQQPQGDMNYNRSSMQQVDPVNAQPLQFDNFDQSSATIAYASDIEIIKDVPLEITVELGRTSKKIADILDFGVGTVIELDKLVGEALDILANGKKVAKGEVVVVDENYGIRITDIIVPEKRMSKL
ncbi:MAG: flagellar motor switch phosphatase FliY [Acidaminobacteraceae bacterium]